MSWADWLILTCGVGGVVLAQIPKTQKYACFAGGAGQFGWFSLVDYGTQPGIWLTCLVYALAWAWGLYLHWLQPWLSSITTPTADRLAGPSEPPRPTRKARPRLVRSKD